MFSFRNKKNYPPPLSGALGGHVYVYISDDNNLYYSYRKALIGDFLGYTSEGIMINRYIYIYYIRLPIFEVLKYSSDLVTIVLLITKSICKKMNLC